MTGKLLERLETAFPGAVVAPSVTEAAGGLLAVLRGADGAEQLAAAAPPNSPLFAHFPGQRQPFGDGGQLALAPRGHASARALRAVLPNLQPRPLGLAAAGGCGDRLGLATPGHARAFHAVLGGPHSRDLHPIFAQQSIREMERTGRAPADVLADATWGAFAQGWRGPLGADADHLKTTADIDACAAAGFTFFTFDPGAYVDSAADTDPAAEIERKVAALPWDKLASTPADLRRRYAGQSADLGGRRLALEPEAISRAAAKYGRAIAHVAALYRHLAAKSIPWEVEVSVDETETPTTHTEHIYFVSELRRLGVAWVSLAPRYVGRFEKGIDYIGDLALLRADLAGHAAIARAYGPYKLSLHSGSDKFSVYPLITELTGGLVHLKTAGTSYLEALRVLARRQPALFRQVAALSAGRYETDRASYHVSAELADWPNLDKLDDAALPALLDDIAARQILHVAFGSALAQYGAALKDFLAARPGLYAQALEAHFVKHLRPFAS